MQESGDQELVRAYLVGNKQALEILIQRHLNNVLAFVIKYTKDQASAEDITQETFVKAWKHLKSYNFDYSFKTWLYTIAKHNALDYLKRKQAVCFSELEASVIEMEFQTLLRDNQSNIFEQLARRDGSHTINELVSQLTTPYQETVRLHYYQELNFREISELIKEPLNTIKTRHRRAITKLQKLFKTS